ncbi:MAG: thioredoxin-disulfide reductase [Candidatus Uhrbacteria bacterium]
MEETRTLIILGGGPAGLTAAIYAARAGLQPLVLAGALPGGQLMLTSTVENFPGFPDGMLGPQLMGNMREQAKRFGAEIINDDAESITTSSPFGVTAAGNTYHAHALIVATGAHAKWLGLPNEQRLIGKGVHVCATCDGFLYREKHVVVVGGGDAAMEEALTLAKLAAKVTIVHRRDQLSASKIMADRVMNHPKIELRWNTVIADVLGDEIARGALFQSTQDGSTEEFVCDGLFIAIGYAPNTGFLKDVLELNEKNYIAVHDRTLTSVDGIFAAGDVEDFRYRQAITAAAGGCMAALDCGKWLSDKQLA